nr:uncharacterized protein LOC109160617 [Ipomoea batatas]
MWTYLMIGKLWTVIMKSKKICGRQVGLETRGVNEVGNEGVHEVGNLVEIQVNIEGENEIVNEGQNVNEPVNAIEDGLEGQTENEAENQPANQPVKDSYGNLDGLNEVQEDKCTNLADPLLETWDAIQIPWEVFENTQEPPWITHRQRRKHHVAMLKNKDYKLMTMKSSLAMDHLQKRRKKKKEHREESHPHAMSEKGTRKKKSLGLTRNGLSFAFPFSIHREQAKCSNGGEVQRRLQQQAPAGMVNSGEQSRWLWLLQLRLASRLLVIVVPRPAACDE